MHWRYRIICIVIFMFKLCPAQGYLALVGGGTEDYNAWSDPVYQWMVDKGDSGKVAVLSYATQSNWIPDYFVSLGAEAAANIQFASAANANDTALTNLVRQCKIVFIKGGNQYNYYARWKNTHLQQAIIEVYQNGGVIAGTSAGAMILSEIVFTSQNGTVYSHEMLDDPYNNYATLADDYFDFLPDMLVDTHFVERGRIGRLMGFLARWNSDHNADILGIGVDNLSALLVHPDLTAEAAGSGAVTFIWKDAQSEVICQPGQPLHFTHINGCQLTAGYQFNLLNRTVIHVPAAATLLNPGLPSSVQIPAGEVWVQGGADISSHISPNGVLSKFQQKYQANYVTVLCDINPNAYAAAQQYAQWFSQNGADSAKTHKIYINALNDPQIAQSIARSDALILTGNSDFYVGDILAGAGTIAAAFQSKINAGIPLLGIGVDGRMVASKLVAKTEGSANNLNYGKLEFKNGVGVWENALIMTRAFDDSDLSENRVGGFLWGMFKSDKSIGVLADERTTIIAQDSLIKNLGSRSILLLDASLATSKDSSRVKIGSAQDYRQCVGFDQYRWQVIAPQFAFNWINRRQAPTGLKSEIIPTPQSFELLGSYPNPFNGSVKVRISTQSIAPIEIKIFNIVGELVYRGRRQISSPGTYHTEWLPHPKIPSGIYLIRLSQNSVMISKKVVYAK